MEIRVYKSEKILEFWDNQKLVQTFPIGIGKVEIGHKQMEGDLKTPEGHYKIVVKNPKSKFYLSLGINYPNLEDAKMGFENGIINLETYLEIETAHKSGKRPPWETLLGGKIYIHGDLESKDWSEGCIRLFNADMEWLYFKANIDTPVIIHP